MLVGTLAALAIAGCSGADDGSLDAAEPDQLAEMAPGASIADGLAEESGGSGSADRAASLSQASLASERRQIMTAGLVVETDGVLAAARQAETITVGAGGFVTDEDTQVQRSGDDAEEATVTVSSLTVRVPPAALDEVLTSLARLGTLVSQNRGTTDVTDEYVDVAARLDSQRASLDRLLQLVGSAGDLEDVIALENEIARRQADLDGLAARLQALDEATELATISLTLTSAEDAEVRQVDDDGFLAGLASGWDAFTGSVVAALTVVGALVPFVALIALIAVPVLVVRRRRTTAQAPPPAAQA